MYKQASKLKLRFDTPNGRLQVEDLWKLPLTGDASTANLDDIARTLSKKVKDAEVESFVVKPPKADPIAQLSLDIVKDVIADRLAEVEAAEKRELNRQKKARLTELLAKKEDAALEELSSDDIRKMIDEL